MVDLQPDGASNLRIAVAFIVVDTTVVLLRLFSKSKVKKIFAADDLWIIVALAFFYGWTGLLIHTIVAFEGTLELATFVSPLRLQQALKVLWVAELFFPLTITFTKISILCLYRSIFSIRSFRIATYIVTGLCVAWLIAGFFVIIFQCTPVRGVYDLSLIGKARCFPFGPFIFTYELINALLDVAILALPIHMIRGLQLPTRRKVELGSIFLLSGFVLVTCALRMIYSFNPKAPQQVPSVPNATSWSTVELGIAIICACLPTYRKLLPSKYVFLVTVQSWYNSLLGTVRTTRTGESGGNASFAGHSNYSRFGGNEEDNSTDRERLTKAVRGRDGGHRGTPVPLNVISVEHRVDVV